MNGGTWPTIAGLTVATFLIKALGPVLFGGRELPAPLAKIVPLLAPALLAALVVVETFSGSGRSLTVDARAAGLAAGALALTRRVPLIGAVVIAAVTTAVIRLIS